MDSASVSISLVSDGAPARPAAARTRMLLEAPIVPTLLRLAAPNVLNLLAFVGLITFDGLFVGRLGPDALAGISLVFPWVMLMQHGAASGMGGAVSSAVARALGAGQRERANALATHAVWLALMLSALFSFLMLLAGPLVYRWMGGRGAILEAAVAYANVAFGGALSIWMLNLLANVVRGTGNMGLPATVIVGCVLGHVVISPMLIFGSGPIPALGPAGAGWGLVTSFGAGSIVLFIHLRSAAAPVTLSFRGIRFQWRLLGEFFRVGVPGMLNVAITNITVIALTGVAGHLNRDTAIAYAMGARLEYIIIPLGFGVGTGIVALVGTNWGAKRYARARAIAWSGGAVVAAACGAVGLFFALFPRLWMAIFTADEEIIRIGVSYLQIVGPAYALYGFGIGLYFACQGYGRLALAVVANGIRLVLAAGGGFIAMFWMQTGAAGMFAAIASGFVIYAGLTGIALSGIKVTPQSKGGSS
ncbi:MAG: MATE family efflux transporter [Betaproteobacteria bacterium]|nr:MATE family efflux transporter [Betaproteobacteria bacterium]